MNKNRQYAKTYKFWLLLRFELTVDNLFRTLGTHVCHVRFMLGTYGTYQVTKCVHLGYLLTNGKIVSDSETETESSLELCGIPTL